MKEVKQFSKTYIFVSALYVVLGAVLIAWPDMSVMMIHYGLSIAMIVIGISYGIMFFTKDKTRGFLQMDLVIGIICLAFGLFLVLNPDFFDAVLPFAMGIILILGAVVKIQNSINMRRLRFRRWYLVLIFAVIIAGLGALLLWNPFKDGPYLILYIGICMVLDGLMNLVTLIFIQHRMRKLNKIQMKFPDADLKTLLDERDRQLAADQKAPIVSCREADQNEKQE